MGYKVVVRFMDLEDNNFIYEEGWDFPRANHFVNKQRIEELASSDNRQGMPLIVESGEVKKPEKDEKVEEIIEVIEQPEMAEPVEEEVQEEEKTAKKSRKKK